MKKHKPDFKTVAEIDEEIENMWDSLKQHLKLVEVQIKLDKLRQMEGPPGLSQN